MFSKRSVCSRSSALLATFLLATSVFGHAPPANPLLHKPAPEFARDDIRGQQVDLASYRGKVVLLTFWATWCAPCQTEMPYFIRWQQELGHRGLQILAVSMDDDAVPVKALMQERGVNYPVIMGDSQLGNLYGGVLGLPVTFLIDRNGSVAGVFKAHSTPAAIKARILKLLASK